MKHGAADADHPSPQTREHRRNSDLLFLDFIKRASLSELKDELGRTTVRWRQVAINRRMAMLLKSALKDGV